MKKTFPLTLPGQVDARVVESVKNDVRKYVRREHRKTLPEGFTLWNFNCKVGPSVAAAAPCALGDLSAKIDEVVRAGGKEVYVEILAEPGNRSPSGDSLPPSA